LHITQKLFNLFFILINYKFCKLIITKNNILGNIPKQITITEDLYPTISFNNGEIEANFGQKPFVFNVDDYFSIPYDH